MRYYILVCEASLTIPVYNFNLRTYRIPLLIFKDEKKMDETRKELEQLWWSVMIPRKRIHSTYGTVQSFEGGDIEKFFKIFKKKYYCNFALSDAVYHAKQLKGIVQSMQFSLDVAEGFEDEE